jgi:tetratricopeptide (TPR) repeat protein
MKTNFSKIVYILLLLFVQFSVIMAADNAAIPELNQELDEVRELVQLKNYDEALTKINQVVEQYPKSEDALKTRIGLLAMVFDDDKQVLDDLVELESFGNKPEEFIEAVIAIYISRYKDEAAQELIDNFIEKYPDSHILLMLQGNLHFIRDDYETAIDNYQSALTLKPNDIDVLSSLARVYFASQKYEKSYQTLNLLLEKDTAHSETTRQTLAYLTSGLEWTLEELFDYLKYKQISWIVEKIDTYHFCYVNEDAKENHDWIRIEYLEDTSDYDEEVESDNSFIWGNFEFLMGCGSDESCKKTWGKLQQIFSELELIAENIETKK